MKYQKNVVTTVVCHSLFVFLPVAATDCALFVAHHCSLYLTPFISASLQTATYHIPEVKYFDSTLGIALIANILPAL